jgi:hypothetical protein
VFSSFRVQDDGSLQPWLPSTDQPFSIAELQADNEPNSKKTPERTLETVLVAELLADSDRDLK